MTERKTSNEDVGAGLMAFGGCMLLIVMIAAVGLAVTLTQENEMSFGLWVLFGGLLMVSFVCATVGIYLIRGTFRSLKKG